MNMQFTLDLDEMSLKRETDAAWVNEIINDPSIKPHVQGENEGPLDISEIVANENNFVLSGKYGAFILVKLGPGYYELHSQVLPEGRGLWASKFAKDALWWFFLSTDCEEIVTRISNRQALALAVRHGFRKKFRVFKGWMGNDCDIYSLTVDEWIGNCGKLSSSGVWFHDKLESLIGHEPHEQDDYHDKFAGLLVEMIRHKNVVKGVNIYNRWAVIANYLPFSILSLDPLILNIRSVILLVKGVDFTILRQGDF